MSGNSGDIILVTGANGFLAGHVIMQLLSLGCKVVGSVRSDIIGKQLADLINNNRFSYEIAELLDVNSFNTIFNKHQITKVIHTAAPYDFSIVDVEIEVIKATVEGMKNLLSSIKEHGRYVTHIVNTSNLSAHFTLEQYSNSYLTLNESSWCNYSSEEGKQNPFKASHYSKAESERVFWDFINKYKTTYTGVSISPAFIFGPQPFNQYLQNQSLNTSINLIQNVLSSKSLDDIPNLFGYVSDVRDIAKVLIKSLYEPDLYYKRLAPFSGKFSLHYILNLTRQHFPKESKHLPPNASIEILMLNFDNSTTLKSLGFDLIDVDKTIYDSVNQILTIKN